MLEKQEHRNYVTSSFFFLTFSPRPVTGLGDVFFEVLTFGVFEIPCRIFRYLSPLKTITSLGVNPE